MSSGWAQPLAPRHCPKTPGCVPPLPHRGCGNTAHLLLGPSSRWASGHSRLPTATTASRPAGPPLLTGMILPTQPSAPELYLCPCTGTALAPHRAPSPAAPLASCVSAGRLLCSTDGQRPRAISVVGPGLPTSPPPAPRHSLEPAFLLQQQDRHENTRQVLCRLSRQKSSCISDLPKTSFRQPPPQGRVPATVTPPCPGQPTASCPEAQSPSQRAAPHTVGTGDTPSNTDPRAHEASTVFFGLTSSQRLA